MDQKQLEELAQAAGIRLSYHNLHGDRQQIAPETPQRLLTAMQYYPVPSLTDEQIIPTVQVFTLGQTMQLALADKGALHWVLTTEQGQQYQGQVRGGQTLTLPSQLPAGYHKLDVTRDSRHGHCRIIVAPERCYEPPALAAGDKLWGVCVQLYTLGSAESWGVGDFGCLQKMLIEMGQRGGAFIGLNPIHALFPANPESASPYSPSSRRGLNILYIDVPAVTDFQRSTAAQQWWLAPETQQQLKQVRATTYVDYSGVMALKLTALHLAWEQFLTRPAEDEQVIAFNAFVCAGGEALRHHALYDALHAERVRQDGSRGGWPEWPDAYQVVSNAAVQHFCHEHGQEISFYLWLQFLADSQLQACWQTSQQAAMEIGLYRDLAVGVAFGGVETWCDRTLYCLQASIGAPPDRLGPQGQNWGLPPMNPHVMVQRDYQPFIDLLRANMAHCGALRIDHVMSMLRLWWIPYGETADKGAYVHYPVEALFAILALESQRHHCMVIGEDLGIVPAEIVAQLHHRGVYSYKVLYFEHDEEGHFRAPADWPVQAMAVATTHDLPTLRGYWEREDLALGERLGLYPDKQILEGLYQERERDKRGLLAGLQQSECLPSSSEGAVSLTAMTDPLNHGIHHYLADSRSAVLGLQPEDWLDMREPVNVPGTNEQYPNWRRKLTVSLEQIFTDEQVNRLLKGINQRRKG